MFHYFLNVLLTIWLITCAFSQSGLLCGKKEVPWKVAMTECLAEKGHPMSFHGITGQSIENINLPPDVTVWTSNFLYSENDQRGHCLCSYRYLSNELFYESSDELLSHCDDFKYLFCRNKTNNVIEVLNNTWDYASRCGPFLVNELISILKPGYYWIGNKTKCGFDGIATVWTENDWQTRHIFCGAYNKGAGRHFRRCDELHRHICISSGVTLRSDLFDDSCFIETASSVSVSRSYSSNLPKADYITQAGLKTQMSQVSTKRIQNTSKTQVNINSTLVHARGSAHDHQDTGTDAAMIAGIVVSVCLTLVAVTVLFIFIQRRCLNQSRSPDYVNDEVSRNEHGTENASFDTIAEAINIGAGDTRGSEQCSNSAKRSENIYNKVEILCNAPEHYYSTLAVKKFVK